MGKYKMLPTQKNKKYPEKTICVQKSLWMITVTKRDMGHQFLYLKSDIVCLMFFWVAIYTPYIEPPHATFWLVEANNNKL